MYPFYNVQPAMFPFVPFFPRKRVRTLAGIPVIKTVDVLTTATQVRYDISHKEFASLPKEGLFILDVRQQVSTPDFSLPVALSDQDSEGTVQTTLHNALAEDVQAGDLQMNGRYLIYYNKCSGSYQLMNAYPATITAPAS